MKQSTSFTCSRHGTFPNRKACPTCAREKADLIKPDFVDEGEHIKVAVFLANRNRATILHNLEIARAREHARVLKMAAAILSHHNEKSAAKKATELALNLEAGSK